MGLHAILLKGFSPQITLSKEEQDKIHSYLANKHGYEIDLIANPSDKKSADSYNRTLDIYQEYKVSKTPSQKSIGSLLR